MSKTTVTIFAIQYLAIMLLGFFAGYDVWNSKTLGAFLAILGTSIVEIAFYLRAIAEEE